MGKGKASAQSTNAKKQEIVLKGCIAPNGCLKEEVINLEAGVPEGAVAFSCSSEKCILNKLAHRECFDFSENEMFKILRVAKQLKGQNEEYIRRSMWTRFHDLIVKYCKCPCGGVLSLADIAEKEDPSDDKKKKKHKIPTKQLPGLVVVANQGVANVGHKKMAKFKSSDFHTYFASSAAPPPCSLEPETPNEPPVGMHRPATLVKENLAKKPPKPKPNKKAAVETGQKVDLLQNDRPGFDRIENQESSLAPSANLKLEPLLDFCEFHIPEYVVKMAELKLYWRRYITET